VAPFFALVPVRLVRRASSKKRGATRQQGKQTTDKQQATIINKMINAAIAVD
jgi:hypothetical protein